MAQVRGIATVGTLLLLSMTLLHCKIAHAKATSYTVGGDDGWTFNTENWPNGKKFVTGDVLEFKYSPGDHNVVVVNKDGFAKCRAPAGPIKVYSSGDDNITLVKGDNYFICGFPGHCEGGMKINATAA